MAENMTPPEMGRVVWCDKVAGVLCRIVAHEEVQPWAERYEDGKWLHVESHIAQLSVFQHAVSHWDRVGLFDPIW